MKVTYEDIKNNHEINVYIVKADETLATLGFTEHSFAHVVQCAHRASSILKELGFSEREQELAKIAGYMHDIGNIINRVDHAQSGAVMAFRILDNLGMEPEEIAVIISAIGNHDEGTAAPVSPIACALILGDKTDVRRTRVRKRERTDFDIHDRVNYAVEKARLYLNEDKTEIILDIAIDTKISSVMSYFEIFLTRMLLCTKAAEALGIKFSLVINGQRVL